MLYGGLKFPVQRFSRTGANINVGMLWIVLITLLVPSLMHLALTLDPKLDAVAAESLVQIQELHRQGRVQAVRLYGPGLSGLPFRPWVYDGLLSWLRETRIPLWISLPDANIDEAEPLRGHWRGGSPAR